MAELQPIIVFHGRHFVRHLEIFDPACVKLFQIMSDIIQGNLKNDVSISNRFPGVHNCGIHALTNTHTHTHTHTHRHTDTDTHRHTHRHTTIA